MQDVVSYMSNMQRPRLLVRAARIGADEYRRESHLSRVLGTTHLPKNTEALMRLRDIEGDINALRLAEDASYSLPKHVDVLIAMVGETRLLTACRAKVS